MKKIFLFIIIIGLAVSAWYLFLKPGDYTARFSANTTPGNINQIIKRWNELYEGKATIGEESENSLTQHFTFNDSVHIYNWLFTPINDTLTDITVHINDNNHSISNRINKLISDTPFEQRSKTIVLSFYDVLESHLEKTKVIIEGTSVLPAATYAYTIYDGKQSTKVSGMMRDLGFLESLMIKNDIPLKGTPFLEVTYWDRIKDSLSYRFGFPIEPRDSLPVIKDIYYDKRSEQKAIKAIYNGNYITSDRAWYALLSYAKNNNIKVEAKPTEVFYNNPNAGGAELSWKAEVFLPIIE